MRSTKQIILDCSRAGHLGASVRWENHVKIPTTQIRINTHDRDYLSNLASHNSISVARIVAFLCDRLRSGEISLPTA